MEKNIFVGPNKIHAEIALWYAIDENTLATSKRIAMESSVERRTEVAAAPMHTAQRHIAFHLK